MHFSTYLILYIISFQIVANSHAVDFSNLSTGQTQLETGQLIKIDHECHYPFNPSSIVTIIIFQKKELIISLRGRKVRLAFCKGN